MVRLNVTKLDKAWRYNRVPPGGEPYIDTLAKYQDAKEWVETNEPIWASTVGLDDDDKGEGVYFIDGRNRFAALRDLGYTEVEAWACRSEVAQLKRRYSTAKLRT